MAPLLTLAPFYSVVSRKAGKEFFWIRAAPGQENRHWKGGRGGKQTGVGSAFPGEGGFFSSLAHS